MAILRLFLFSHLPTTETAMRQDRTIAGSQPRNMERYAEDSPPEALLITCTDPILDSRLLAQFRSEPLLVWRSTGPVVPPYGSGYLKVESIIDHAVTELGAREIAICGHLPNEALRSLIGNQAPLEGPKEDPCLYYAHAARRIVQEKYGRLQPDELRQAMVEENVLLQMANLRTYPAVLAGMACRNLRLHSWIYDADQDELYGHGPSQSLFLNRIKQFAQPAEHPLPYLDPCDIYLA